MSNYDAEAQLHAHIIAIRADIKSLERVVGAICDHTGTTEIEGVPIGEVRDKWQKEELQGHLLLLENRNPALSARVSELMRFVREDDGGIFGER